jgi:hypothetical protein
MKHILKTLSFALLLVLAMSGQSAQAVPATPHPIEIVQPDGQKLTIRLHGDEYYHYRTTLDGIRIAKNKKGFYCYAIKDKHGNDIAGRKIAHNQEQRKKSEIRYIKRINKKYYNKK